MIDWLRESFHRLRSVFRRAQLDNELDAELATHLELAIEEYLQRGMPADEARRQALIRFGGTEQAKWQHREERGRPHDALKVEGRVFSAGARKRRLGLASSQSQADVLNPAAFIASSLFLFGVAISASYVPARRALSVDPLVVLR